MYGVDPRVGISNLPILPSVLSNLVTEAQLNEVYCKMVENPSQDTAQLPKLFQDQVKVVADAANVEALVSLSPVQIKLIRKCSPEDINMSMMDLSQAKRDARDAKKAKINALKEAVFSLALLPLPMTVRAGQKVLRVPIFLIVGWNYMKSEIDLIDLSPFQKFE